MEEWGHLDDRWCLQVDRGLAILLGHLACDLKNLEGRL